MFLASKLGWAGMALALLTTGILVTGFPRRPTKPDSNQERVETFVIKNEIMKMQETLHAKGYYQGKADGIFGLRTRASIRAFQKAEKLPFTGQVDTWTASRLGIRPESTWGNSESAGREVGYRSDGAVGEAAKVKPSPYKEWAKGSGQTGSTLRENISKANAIEDKRGDNANQQQAENENHEQ